MINELDNDNNLELLSDDIHRCLCKDLPKDILSIVGNRENWDIIRILISSKSNKDNIEEAIKKYVIEFLEKYQNGWLNGEYRGTLP